MTTSEHYTSLLELAQLVFWVGALQSSVCVCIEFACSLVCLCALLMQHATLNLRLLSRTSKCVGTDSDQRQGEPSLTDAVQ